MFSSMDMSDYFLTFVFRVPWRVVAVVFRDDIKIRLHGPIGRFSLPTFSYDRERPYSIFCSCDRFETLCSPQVMGKEVNSKSLWCVFLINPWSWYFFDTFGQSVLGRQLQGHWYASAVVLLSIINLCNCQWSESKQYAHTIERDNYYPWWGRFGAIYLFSILRTG